MRRIRQWMALALSVLVLADAPSVYATQQSGGDIGVVTEQETAGGTETTEPEENITAESEVWENPIMVETTALETSMPEMATEPVSSSEYTSYLYENEATNLESDDYYLTLDNTYRELAPGEQMQLQVDTNIPAEQLTYASSDTSVLTVTQTGLVTAVSGGMYGENEAQIEVRWQNPNDEWNYISRTCWLGVQNTISISETSIDLYKNQKPYQLTAVTNPAGTVTWSVENTEIATIDATGKVTPKKSGYTRIRATANGVSADCYLGVNEPVLSLDATATVYKKNKLKLKPTVLPAAKVTWKSSNKKVATVNAGGVVTGKKKGTATITAKANGITKKCKITVQEPQLSIYTGSYWNNTVGVFQGSTCYLGTDVPSYINVKWKTSNKKVAKVDKDGNITGVKPGTVTITASIPGAKATCKVKVLKNKYNLNFNKKTIMVQDTATLYIKDIPEGVYPSFSTLDSTGNVTLTWDGNSCEITGQEKGNATIRASFQTYMDGYYVKWSQDCTVMITDTGISKQQFSIAKGTNKQLKVIEPEGGKTITAVAWSSSAPEVAVVDATTGLVTAKKKGDARIAAVVTYADGSKTTYTSSMRVSDPKLKSSSLVVAVGGEKSIGLTGINAYSEIKWNSKNKKAVSVSADGTIKPYKKKNTTINVTVDGKKLSCKVSVSNPSLNAEYAALPIGGTSTVKVKGLVSKSKVTYESSNPAVATITGNKVTAKKGGRSEITIKADGKKMVYLVEVASQTALNACKEGLAIISRSTYSQALRMTEGYYDCSSLVFRGYGRNTGLLGGISGWAPTAAGMAQYMAQTGKVLSWSGLPVEELRPGDLIFYGQTDNGRYLGIYHVSMYYGNGYRLEKPLDGYYERDNIVMIARPAP